MDDLELIRRFVERGEQEAFGELVRRHLDMVYSAAVRQVGAAEAEDICQGVFLELARRARTLRADSSVGTWLYVVTRRTAVDWIRKESRRVKREQAAILEDANMENPDWSRLGPQLDAAMEALSDEDRRAIVMRFFENRRLKEIGDALRLSEDAAQKRISRAVDKLRDALIARGLATFSAVLATELSAHAVAPAPAGLAGAIAGGSHAVGAASGAGSWVATIAGAAALALAIGFAAHQMHAAHSAAAQVTALKEELQGAQGWLRTEELALRQAASPMPKVVFATAKEAESDPALKAKAVAMLRAVANLRQHLKGSPERAIPEMRLLTDKDWLEVARQYPAPETDEDYRRAYNALREAAKSELAPRMKSALQAYEDDHGGSLPPDTLQLATYFDPPVEADILERYVVTAHPNPRSSSDSIYERTSALVDADYENAMSFGTGGWSVRGNGVQRTGEPFELDVAIGRAEQEFRGEHPGRRPTREELVPYFTDPADAQRFLATRPPKP